MTRENFKEGCLTCEFNLTCLGMIGSFWLSPAYCVRCDVHTVIFPQDGGAIRNYELTQVPTGCRWAVPEDRTAYQDGLALLLKDFRMSSLKTRLTYNTVIPQLSLYLCSDCAGVVARDMLSECA